MKVKTKENKLHSYSCSAGSSSSRTVFPVFIFIPVSQHVGDPRRAGQLIHLFKILFCNFKRLSGDVGDVLPDQLAGVDGRLVDLLEQEGPEGLDAGAEECAVEGNVDALERDGGEPALQDQGFRLRFSLLHALIDDLNQMALDVLERHLLHEGLDIDLLRFEDVEHICQAVESTKLWGR